MNKIIHRAGERGYFNHGWLETYHSFSFGGWFDRNKMGFGLLRVLNDDTVAPGKGFGMHPHDNMEIVTIILKGQLKHRDSMGNEGIIKVNEIQAMSAGSGILHSEYNPSETESCSLFQIWIRPSTMNIKPRYEQKSFDFKEKNNRFMTLVSPKKSHETIFINQNAYFSIAAIDKDNKIEYKLRESNNGIYLMVIEGEIKIDNDVLSRRDAIGISGVDVVSFEALTDSEILVIEVPMG
jgi:redox-sensitive bicupin YhaK (pirin superfamily)